MEIKRIAHRVLVPRHPKTVIFRLHWRQREIFMVLNVMSGKVRMASMSSPMTEIWKGCTELMPIFRHDV